jgi:Trk K+ transport system NAD-binding subunit
MRAPLLLLSTVYCIATVGLTMIPGVDDQGQVWYMGFFHAFYFVSFMGTTIGFGEIPYEFSDGQRLWVLVWIYITVAAWIYALGKILGLLQDETLKKAFVDDQFERSVNKLTEPFYVVCGYGDTGSKLVDALERHLITSSVVEIRQERIDALILANHPIFVPRLCGDASDPENLRKAGICHPLCAGVVALTDENSVNLHIAITCKVLNPDVQVICRAESREVEANMASFGTDIIVDPFDTFADRLSSAMTAPSVFLVTEWLRADSDAPLREIAPMPEGRWVLCGFGRFGQAIYDRLVERNLPVQVIEPSPDTRPPPEDSVIGWGTEAATLREAKIESAVGIIVGTHDDSNNLSIIVTSKEINPGLFVIVRQNEHINNGLFDVSRADIVMDASAVVARKIKTHITDPLLEEFIAFAMEQDEEWGRHVEFRLLSVCERIVPETWTVRIDEEQAYAVLPAVESGDEITLGDLLTSHIEREKEIDAIVLMVERAGEFLCLPDKELVVEPNDAILFAGTRRALTAQQWTLQNQVAFTYIRTGSALPQSWVWRVIRRLLRTREAASGAGQTA